MLNTRRSRLSGIIDDNAVFAFSNTKCIDIDGVDEWVNCGAASVFDFERTDAFSLSIWVKTTANARSYALLAKNGWNYTVTPGYYLRMNSNGSAEVYWVVDASNRINVYTTTGNTLNDGSWHHVAVAYSGSSTAAGIKIYIDGTSASLTTAEDTMTTGSMSNAKAFSLGALAGEDFWYLGKLDEASAWDKELSGAEVTEIYNNGAANSLLAHSANANLIGWWRCGDEDTHPTLLDNSTNSNNGTMTNTESGDIVTDAPS